MKRLATFLGFFTLSILLVFIYVRPGQILGAVDSWMYLYSFAEHRMWLSSWLNASDTYFGFYPDGPLSIFGETCYGISAIYQLLRSVSFGEAAAFNTILALIITGNAVGLYVLVRQLGISRQTAIAVSVMFMACTTSLSYFCQINMLALFPLLFTQALLVRWKVDLDLRRGLIIGLLLAVTIYFSGYVFLMNAICTFIFLASWSYSRRRLPMEFSAGLILITGLLIAPYAAVVWKVMQSGAYNPDVSQIATTVLSFHPRDLLRSLDGNQIYSFTSTDHFHRVHSFNNGFLILLLAVIGISTAARQTRSYLLVLFGVFAVMACGLFYYISYDFFLNKFFRMPMRAWFVCHIILSIVKYPLEPLTVNSDFLRLAYAYFMSRINIGTSCCSRANNPDGRCRATASSYVSRL